MFTKEEIESLRRGEMVEVEGKMYAVCAKCRRIVCLNKWLLGSTHVCE